MGLFKYVTADTAEKILKGSIRFTQPGAFNDPFELLPQFATDKDFADQLHNFRFCVLSPRRKGLDRSHIRIPDEYGSDIHARKLVSAMNDQIGILCLSRNLDSLSMWGHYADEYRGAVIEFHEHHEFFNGLNSVKYQKRRPVFNITDFLGRDIPISDLCVKSKAWEYEKEVRVVRSVNDLKVSDVLIHGHKLLTMDVPISCIKAVYMGERMAVGAQQKIWSLVKDTNIALSLAAVSNWEYSFGYDLIKLPGALIGTPIISPRTAHVFKDEPGDLGEIAQWMLDDHPLSEFFNQKC
ncbi:hypothetical protein AAY86_18520 [Pseudomonas amygdali pv. tabaci str. ATCC 11528]|uniref:DUF2971 domain-containing protein n=1 Tax=Pseudomonas amygdali TaxID=47877 RepID=UPI00062B5C69|nr:DUF2971 domain-containing protein [Pseudomonas amygdali]KKY51482.1 hypothetical protein AAY86_18520 [Pseudomonas amygdali pv. tabaci str. ATCC 11528]